MKKRAFTMVELILVIVIFGIIGAIGADIIATMYKNYIQARTINYLQSQSDITLQQIAKRLQYRIKDTAIAYQSGAAVDTNNPLQLSDSRVGDTYDVIEWIGYSNEALLNAGGNPGWSGFVDLDSGDTSSTGQSLSTPGSNLTFAKDIISTLTNGDIDLTTNKEAALIFRDAPALGLNIVEAYNWEKGGGRADPNYIIPVTNDGDNIFDITLVGIGSNITEAIYEQYYLAHTAYAIVTDGIDKDFKLNLHYNFQPWAGERYKTSGNVSLLADNVNLFRVRQTGSTIRLKLCLHDGNKSGAGDFIVTCKEEVVL
ncbi:MAG: prepilin-type N-terminal cleavage/methylation domain-containing protein [Campylobacteraceae bacterium]|jgi:prepilin-type N-terminal cleavage/methylation domain-containing protein|nr:prepilin-type N-terminal cleavage/methylation domain-containing protein [Campylobacteraceae bacterium]